MVFLLLSELIILGLGLGFGLFRWRSCNRWCLVCL